MVDPIALSLRAGGVAAPDALMPRGLMIFDLALPLAGTTILLDHRSDTLALSLIHDRDAGFGLGVRRAGRLVRHALPGVRADGRGTAQVQFRWDAPADLWSLRFATPGGAADTSSGRAPTPLPEGALASACIGGGGQHRAAALLSIAATPGPPPPKSLPRIGLRTPVDTPRGPVAAGALRPGDTVLTRDAGPLPILALHRADVPGTGGLAPVRLRAPYFLHGQDALVSPDQRIAFSGVEVEYLFGEDTVLVEARHLTDGTRALRDDRARLVPSVTLDLGQAALIGCDGCTLATEAPGAAPIPLRSLDRWEAVTLHAMRRRGADRTFG